MTRLICPDGGTCTHECEKGGPRVEDALVEGAEVPAGACWRVANCGPLSAARFPGDRWPEGAKPIRPTDAERAALRWAVLHGTDLELRGGDFVSYYEERERAVARAEGRDVHYSTSRAHAWRRTGGKLLGRMQERGLVRRIDWRHGVPIYELTSAGRTAAAL